MRFLRVMRQALNYLWHGPADLPRSLQLEWRFVSVRWLGILMVGPGLWLAHLPPDRLLSTYAVLGIATIWSLAVQVLMPKYPSQFVKGYLPTAGDSLLNIAMVTAGGGFSSPFYYLLFTVTMSAAMRYGYGPSLAMVLTFVSFDVLERLPAPQFVDGPFLFRSGFLCITAILASYLRQQAQRAEAALQERLRQASLVNEAAAKLGASLELDRVLEAVVAAASNLFGSDHAVLLPATGLDGGATGLPAVVHYPSSESTEVRADLATLCRHYMDMHGETPPGDSFFHHHVLPSRLRAIVLVLAPPTRQTPLATLALAAPPGQPALPLDPDILESFAERTALAIENASLYRKLAGRSNELQRAYADLATAHQELLSVDEMKTNFLANVSHELRTPLSSIRSFSELLLTYDDDASVRREFLQIINAESERLTRLVNDVLDITKIESGNMDWHETSFDLAELLHETARTFSGLMAEHRLSFEADIAEDLPIIHADRDRLQQMVSNLLSNAVKFTPGGTIRLSARREGQQIYVSVADTGIGLSKDDQARIFDKFQQVGATLTDKATGTGLGLAISREIIDYHHGCLWVESQPGEGSTFTFSLPVVDGAVPAVEWALVAA